MKRILTFYMIVFILAGLSGFSVHAHNYGAVKTGIEAEVRLGGLVTIIPDDIDCPVPEKTEIDLKDGEVGKFNIDFTKVGVYNYTVRTIADDRDLKFDKTVYHVKFYVTDEDGELSVTVVVLKGGNNKYGTDSKRLVFVNTASEGGKKPPVPKTEDNSGTKTIFMLVMIASAVTLAGSVYLTVRRKNNI